jgi:hypothetical protein
MDFTKKTRGPVRRGPLRPPLLSDQDPEPLHPATEDYIRQLNLDGFTLLPGETEPKPMIGIDPQMLKAKLEQHEEVKKRLLRDIAATWKCLKCGRETPGRNVRIRVEGGLWQMINGVRTLVGGEERTVCPLQACNGPVIKIKDPYRSRLI